MSTSVETALLEERAPRRRPPPAFVGLGLVAVGAGAVFGAILAAPLDVPTWLAAVLACAYACVIVATGSVLLVQSQRRTESS